MSVVQVFSRQGCHLCEVLIEELLPLVRGAVPVEVVDIDTRPELQDLYGQRVPVVEIDGHFVCQFHLDRDAVLARLGPAIPGKGE